MRRSSLQFPFPLRCRERLALRRTRAWQNILFATDLVGDGLLGDASALAGVQVRLAGNGLGGLLNNLLALGEDQLDVAWVGHVWVDLYQVSERRINVTCQVNVLYREHGMCGDAALVPG